MSRAALEMQIRCKSLGPRIRMQTEVKARRNPGLAYFSRDLAQFRAGMAESSEEASPVCC